MVEAGIEAFLAVMQTGGVSKAAERLHLAQPSVSKRIQLLEEQLGVSLFERGRGMKGFELTPAGELFLNMAERWAALYKEMEGLKTEADMHILSVGGIAGINMEVLYNVLKRLMEHDPPVRLRIAAPPSSKTLYERVEQRVLDVALVRVELSYPNVITQKLYSQQLVGICLKDSPLASQRNVHPRHLRPEHELFNPTGPTYNAWHDKWWDAYCPARTVVDSIYMMLALMSRPEHWGLVPERVARAACKRGGHAMFHLSIENPGRSCFKIMHKHPRASALPALEIFDACLEQELADQDFPTF